MDTLEWIENWYASQCDGDWEHDNGISIGCSDNPGWIVEISLVDTDLEDLMVEYKLVEGSETRVDEFGTTQSTDWYGFSIKDKMFSGCGDPSKLRLLLEIFRKIAQAHSTT